MATTNQDIINKFFDSYSKRDFDGIRQVMADNVSWSFLGQHKLAGVKNGIEQVVAFFDTMGGIMSKSKPSVDKLVLGSNDNYVVECQHIKTDKTAITLTIMFVYYGLLTTEKLFRADTFSQTLNQQTNFSMP